MTGLRILLIALALAGTSVFAQNTVSFEKADLLFEKTINEGDIVGGTLLVWHGEKIAFHKAYGFADRKTKRPFEKDTPCVVASISKPLLGTALYRLADQKKLDPAAPITRYLPEFADRKLESGEALKRPPTLTELLTHSSGLRPDNAKNGRVWYQSWTRDQKLEFVVSGIARDFPFKAQPGTKYAYSGIGTEVAARIGEVVSERPRNELLVAELAKPLGMTSTFYRDQPGLESLGREMPRSYLRSKQSGKIISWERRPPAAKNGYSSSGGSVISTAPDLLRWLRMILNKGRHEDAVFLQEESIEAMLHPHSVGANAQGGLFVRDKDEKTRRAIVFGHTGSSGTNIWINRETGTIGIMLTQTRGSDIKPFRIELEKLVNEAVADSLTSAP